MSDVQKLTLRIGQRLLGNTAEPGAWAGLPTEFLDGGASVVGASASALNTESQSAYNVEVPNRPEGDGPIHAIAIAPDSPIAECNLHIPGKGRYRVGVGCPYIGRIDNFSHVQVSPARGIPALYRYNDTAIPTLAQHREWVRVWECDEVESLDLTPFGGGVVVAIPKLPLKLHLYRGSAAQLVVSQQKRSGYHAEMLWRNDGTREPTLIGIVDGRRRVRVRATRRTVADGGAAASLTIYGINSAKTSDSLTPVVAAGRIDEPVFDQLLAATALPDNSSTDTIFDLPPSSVNPYFAIAATITGANLGRGSVSISAWDD